MDPLAQERLLEQIDACRHGVHGADDLRNPALSDLAQAVAAGDERACRMLAQVEAADAAISAALHDVEVPDDLAERLLVALKAAEQGEPVDAAALRRKDRPPHAAILATATNLATAASLATAAQLGATEGTGDASAVPACRAKPTTRRAWLGWTLSVGAAVAAAVTLFCLLYPWPPPWVKPEEIAQDINVLYDSEIALIDADAWTSGTQVSLPSDLTALSLSSERWREFTFGRHSATAYDLVSSGSNRRATLVVINWRVRGLDCTLPRSPQLSTHGRSIGIWQSEAQSHVFALIVEGTEHDYRQIVEQQAIA